MQRSASPPCCRDLAMATSKSTTTHTGCGGTEEAGGGRQLSAMKALTDRPYVTPSVIESRYAQAIPGGSYGQHGQPSMSSHAPGSQFGTPTSAPSVNGQVNADPTAAANPFAYEGGFPAAGPSFGASQAVSAGPSAPQHPGVFNPSATQPMPYSFLPPTPPTPTQPPTPNSAAASPAASGNDINYFENYINRTLQIHSPSASRAATPSRPAAQPSFDSPDPLSMTGPSPTKKHKSNSASRHESPTPHHGNQLARHSSGVMLSLPQFTPEAKKAYKSISSLSDPQRSTMSIHSTPQFRRDESDEDDIDWGHGARDDADGDWTMHTQEAPLTVAPPSGRTGDKDHRSGCSLWRSS